MENCEALLLKKSNYGEADLIVTFFTNEFGKVRALARRAKKSNKRFGGRLQLFNHLKLRITLNENKFNIVNDISIIKSYQGIMNDLNSFMVASFILEHLDIFTFEIERNDELFNLAVNSLDSISKNGNLFPNLLNFQIKSLKLAGYEPNLSSGGDSAVYNFSISEGSIIEDSANFDKKDIFKFYLDIIKNPDSMDTFLYKVVNNIRVLTKYIEYHIEKQFKTSQFLEDLNI